MKTKQLFFSFLIAALFCVSFTQSSKMKYTLEKKWQTDSIMKVPESVLYDDTRNILYIANINGKPDEKDGNGFISKISLGGKVEKIKWVIGLDAPKGMGMYKDKLYVTDVTRLVIIDVITGKILKKIEVPGSKFLNDVTIDATGKVYFTDSSDKKIYTLKGDKAEVWKTSESWASPNGLLAVGKDIYVVDMGNGNFTKIAADKSETIIADSLQGGDGIEMISTGEFLISNWYGEVNHVSANGHVVKLLDTKDQKLNAADIEYVSSKKLLLVPTFFGNTIAAYELK